MFCKYCGKQIPDGATCDCPGSVQAAQRVAPQPVYQEPVASQPAYQEPVAPQYAEPQYDPNTNYNPAYDPDDQDDTDLPAAPAGPNFGQILGDAFKEMPVTLTKLMGNTMGAGVDLVSAAIFAVGTLLLNIISWVLMLGVDGMVGVSIATGILCYLVPNILAMLIPTCGQLIRKEKVDLVQNFVTVACANVLPSVLLLLAALFFLFLPIVGLLFAMAAIMLGIVIDFKLLAKQMKNTGTVVGSLVTALVLALIAIIVVWVVSAPVIGFIEDQFRNLGGLLNFM